MKQFAICLTLALFCGVVLSNNFTNTKVCDQARQNITKAVKDIEAQRRRMYPDADEIATLQNTILFYRRMANSSCTAEELCYKANLEIVKTREDLADQNRKIYPDAKIISQLNQDIAYFKDQIERTCPGAELCANAIADVKIANEVIAIEKRRMYPDDGKISSLEEDIRGYKRVIVRRCPANESCAFAHAKLTSSREALATEKRRMYPDANEIAKLEADITNSSELIIGTCNNTDVCNFVQAEILKVREATNTETSRTYRDRNAILKLQSYLGRLNEVHFYRCQANFWFKRLAEVAVGGGRFLAKMLRH